MKLSFKHPGDFGFPNESPFLFFMHIPKTAGTSFRFGAEKYFGKKNIVYDYGIQSLVTSELVRRHFYGDKIDHWSFLNECLDKDVKMIGGHVKLDKFVSLASLASTVTFIREPLQRIASEYAHHVRYNGYEGSFQDFYRQPHMQNTLNRYLAGIAVEAVGFVGVSERYDDCLDAINEVYDLDIPVRNDNSNLADPQESYAIDAEEEEELRSLNQGDLELYQYCNKLLDLRLSLLNQQLPYTHGNLRLINIKQISGWAWSEADSLDPVELELLVNAKVEQRIPASELCRELSHLRPPRGGYIGFNAPFNLKAGDEVQGRVASSGQLFPLKPLVVD